MPWFQRKARPWDDHWDLYTFNTAAVITGIPLLFHVPDNIYLELTHVSLSVNFGLIGFGGLHYPEIVCLRGSSRRWFTAWDNTSHSAAGRRIIFANVPFLVGATKTLQGMYVPLPSPCHLIPGDHLSIGMFGYVAGDFISQIYLTFKSWRIY